jgi:DNA-binding MarR family transcriptional regulator
MKKHDITLIEQFITLSRMMMHRHHHMKGNHQHSPYRGQGRILSLLKMEPQMSQKKLSFLLGTRPQSIGELLVKLEQNGYITRKQSDEDRRSLDIELTEEGMKAAISEENLQECQHKTNEMFSCLNEEEQKNLSNYLERVIASLQEEMMDDQEDQDDFSQHHMHHHEHDHHDHEHGHDHHDHHHRDHHMKCCGHRPEKF